MATAGDVCAGVVENVEKVVVGKTRQVRVALAATIARGHVLIEDVPGVAKTMLARSFAVTFGCDFKRIQCTSDLLPGDITGTSVFDPKRLEFEFLPGPAFTNFLLADEINRATPRTQSALLEAMEERQVSTDGTTRPLPPPFVVFATQNPVEQEGTFPLPEAQLDRFMVRIGMGYPDFAQETEMLDRQREGHPLERLKATTNAESLLNLQRAASGVFVHPAVRDYLVRVVQATRESIKLGLAASPRASIALYRCAQAMALVDGRAFVSPDDVKALAVPVLAHRLILKPEFRLRKETPALVVEEILRKVDVPSGASMRS